MSFGFSLDFKEQVRQATDIVQLAGEYVRLTPKGRGYVGLCPWHDDSSPSLQIDPRRQTYRCWVCNVGGDVFSFVMKAQNVTFPEALEFLAERAGIPMPEKKKSPFFKNPFAAQENGSRRPPGGGEMPSDSPDSSASPEITKKTLFAACAWAEDKYHQCLLESPSAEIARAYFRDREISEESIRKFKLGFAPAEWDWIERQLPPKNASRLQTLEAAGVLGRSEHGKYYDRFRGRVIFPIHDATRRSVGIGARTIPGVPTQNESAKYINTPETPLFLKRKMLYALDLAAETMRKTHRVLVMEGYMDTIVAHQHGFTDAVAVLGTAVGMDHIRVLKRHVDTIYLILDGDSAGQRRTLEVLSLFVAENVDVRILTLPEGMDPAEFLQKHGAAAFEEMLREKTVDALQHAYNVYTKNVDLSNIHAGETALENILKLVAEGARYAKDVTSESTFREFKLMQNLSFLFRVPEEILRARLNEMRADIRRERNRMPYIPEENGSHLGNRPDLGSRRRPGDGEAANHSPFTISAENDKTPNDNPSAALRRRDDDGYLSETEEPEPDSFFTENPSTSAEETSADSPPEKNFNKISKKDENSDSPPFPDADETIKSKLSIKEDAVISEKQHEAQDFISAFESVPAETADPASSEYFLQNADTLDWAVYGKMDAFQHDLLELLIFSPSLLSFMRCAFSADHFTYLPARELVTRMCEMEDDGTTPTFERLLMVFESEKIQSWLVSLEASASRKLERKTPEEQKFLLGELLEGYDRFRLRSQKLIHTGLFRSADLDGQQKASMLEQLIEDARKNTVKRQ